MGILYVMQMMYRAEPWRLCAEALPPRLRRNSFAKQEGGVDESPGYSDIERYHR